LTEFHLILSVVWPSLNVGDGHDHHQSRSGKLCIRACILPQLLPKFNAHICTTCNNTQRSKIGIAKVNYV